MFVADVPENIIADSMKYYSNATAWASIERQPLIPDALAEDLHHAKRPEPALADTSARLPHRAYAI